MSITLFIFSLLLHLISFYFIILLFSKFHSVKLVEQKQKKMLEDMTASFEVFLDEMQDENNRLIESLQHSNETLSSSKKDPFESKPEIQVANNSWQRKVSAVQANASYAKNTQSSKETKPKNEAIVLKEQGYSIAEIAKRLGKGKIEVELMIKFAEE